MFAPVQSNPPDVSDDQIHEALSFAVQQLLDRDWDLVALGGHEQAIAHRIAVYLELSFEGYHVDCEYNRRKHATKVYSGESGQSEKGMRPDIIVHRRDTDVNVLAIEMKANANKDTSNDMKKLKALRAEGEGYVYRAIAFIEVRNGLPNIEDGELSASITWFDATRQSLVELHACKVVLTNDGHRQAVKAIVDRRRAE